MPEQEEELGGWPEMRRRWRGWQHGGPEAATAAAD